MPGRLRRFSTDLRAPIERDPAARGWLDVVLSYPGFHALTAYRVTHRLWQLGVPLLPRWLSHVARFLDRHRDPSRRDDRPARLHRSRHGRGHRARPPKSATAARSIKASRSAARASRTRSAIRRLGRTSRSARAPCVLGAITVGDNARVGSGSVVVRDVPRQCDGCRNSRARRRAGRQTGPRRRRIVRKSRCPIRTLDAINQLRASWNSFEARFAQVEREDGEETWSWVI